MGKIKYQIKYKITEFRFIMKNNTVIMIGRTCRMHGKNKTIKCWLQNFNVREKALNEGVDGRVIYILIDM